MAANEDVLFEVKNGVATITFNRPNKGNAITPAMLELMAEKLKVPQPLSLIQLSVSV